MRIARLQATSALQFQEDAYIYQIICLQETLAAIASDNSLRLLDRLTLHEIAAGSTVNLHDSVTKLSCPSRDCGSLMTAGRDGLVRRWDPRSGSGTRSITLLQGSKLSGGIFLARTRTRQRGPLQRTISVGTDQVL